MMWQKLFIASLLGHAVAIPAFSGNSTTAPSILQLFPRETDADFDPSDLSWIKKLAAIGDSYSAGIGAGNRLGGISDWACSRYDHAYPELINTDIRLGDPASRKFQFESCSGATTKDVLSDQIPNLNSNQQAILLSVGGNDVELKNILNQCIFQWAVMSPKQGFIAKAAAVLDPRFWWAKDFDWDEVSRGCEKQLERTQTMIESSTFNKNIDRVLEAAKLKLAKDGMIYFTGYGKFFSEALTDECDSVSWAIWIFNALNMQMPKAKLTKKNRMKMNGLVDSMNAKLEAAAKRAGSSVEFVNYDKYIGQFGGRYCEPGVDESTKQSNTRTGLMFYEMNTWDFFGTNPHKRSPGDVPQGTFSGDINMLAQIKLISDPKAELAYSDDSGNQKPVQVLAEFHEALANKVVNTSEKIVRRELPNLLPDGYGRVFHPQILLHQIISNLVIFRMTNNNEKKHGFPAIPEVVTIDQCPLVPKPDVTVGKQHCYDSFTHNPTDATDVQAISNICKAMRVTLIPWEMSAGKKEIPVISSRAPGFKGEISWVPGCKGKALKVVDPHPDYTCEELLYNDWKDCNNGGAGGYRDIGCVRYSFKPEKIVNPTDAGFPPKLGPQHCFHPFKHEPVSEAAASSIAPACEFVGMMESGTKFMHYLGAPRNTPFNNVQGIVSWIPGCKGGNVFPSSPDQHPACKDFMFDNWRNCDNGGAGGYRDLGCIRYTFLPCENPTMEEDGVAHC